MARRAERKRSQKWYNKHEIEIMKQYGLVPTKRSGAGWIEKEDGYNDKVLCQLKSTDSDSYRISLDDVRKLEYHATVERKKPMFMVDFIDREQYIIVRADDLKDVCLGLLGIEDVNELQYDSSKLDDIILDEPEIVEDSSVVKSSRSARDKFMKERELQWQKRKK